MEIKKPKAFTLPDKIENELPGIAVWGEHTAISGNQNVIGGAEIFNDYNLFIGTDRWEVKCSGFKVTNHATWRPILGGGAQYVAQQIKYDPLRCEFYDANVPFRDSELFRWMTEISEFQTGRNGGDPNRYRNLKRELLFEAIGPRERQFKVCGAYLMNITISSNIGLRFDIDAIAKCEIEFDRFEIL